MGTIPPNRIVGLSSQGKIGQRQSSVQPGEYKNFPVELQSPVAVFSYGNVANAQNIILEISRNGKNFLVGLHLNQSRNGLEINDVRGLFPKDTNKWLNWIEQGKLRYLNKSKIRDIISQRRTNLAEVAYIDTDSIDNIIENF